jgi:hypothetical protein
VQPGLGDPHAPDVHRRHPFGARGPDDELRGAAADVHDEVRGRDGRVQLGRRTEKGQRSLFLPGQELGWRFDDLGRGGEEVLAVGRARRSAALAFDTVRIICACSDSMEAKGRSSQVRSATQGECSNTPPKRATKASLSSGMRMPAAIYVALILFP